MEWPEHLPWMPRPLRRRRRRRRRPLGSGSGTDLPHPGEAPERPLLLQGARGSPGPRCCTTGTGLPVEECGCRIPDSDGTGSDHPSHHGGESSSRMRDSVWRSGAPWLRNRNTGDRPWVGPLPDRRDALRPGAARRAPEAAKAKNTCSYCKPRGNQSMLRKAIAQDAQLGAPPFFLFFVSVPHVYVPTPGCPQ